MIPAEVFSPIAISIQAKDTKAAMEQLLEEKGIQCFT